MTESGDSRPEVLDVAVVGGGVAGAYACYQLRHTKQRIGLFEGSGRIGGRLFTYQLPCSPSLNLELGGMRFVSNFHTRVGKLVQALGLTVIPFPDTIPDCPNKPLFYLRGQHLTEEDILHGHVPYALNAEEKANQHRLRVYYLEKLLGVTNWHQASQGHRLNSPSLKTVTGTPLHMLTNTAALEQVSSPDGRTFMRDSEQFPTAGFYITKSSASAAFQSCLSFHDVEQMMTLREGMAAIPQRLVQAFEENSRSHRTYLNHQLTSIDKEGQGLYRLGFRYHEAGDVTAPGNTKTRYRQVLAKRVILALPMPALDAIEWAPLREPSFQEARRCRHSTKILKLFLVFDTPWWRELTDGYSGVFSDQSFKLATEFGYAEGCFALLAAYTDSDNSNLFEVLQRQGDPIPGSAPGDLRISTVLSDFLIQELSTAFGVSRHLVPDPIGGVAKFWEAGLANWTNGCLNRSVLDGLNQPATDEEVFVIGTDVALRLGLHAWVEGAIGIVDEVLSKNKFVSP